MQGQQDEREFCEHLKLGAAAAARKGYPGLAALFRELAQEIEGRHRATVAEAKQAA